MKFCIGLAAVRAVKGMTHQSLATACGFDRVMVTKMELGLNLASSAWAQDGLAKGFGVPLEVIRQLVAGSLTAPAMAEAFGVSLDDLFAALAVAEQRAAEREAA